MQLPSLLPWRTLVIEMAEKGFRPVMHFELSCTCSGDWRSAAPDSESLQVGCPRCGQLHRPFILGRGLTRNTVAWVLVSPSLSRNRNFRLARPRTGRPKVREVTARVLRTANLIVQGKTAPEIARELSLSSSHYHLFLRRRKADIDSELRRITIDAAPAQLREMAEHAL
jgi:hypothetical protein